MTQGRRRWRMQLEFPYVGFLETIAMLPGDWDLAHAIRLGIKPFAELGANSEALSGHQVDSPYSCRAIFKSAPVAMLQSRFLFRYCQYPHHSARFGLDELLERIVAIVLDVDCDRIGDHITIRFRWGE